MAQSCKLPSSFYKELDTEIEASSLAELVEHLHEQLSDSVLQELAEEIVGEGFNDFVVRNCSYSDAANIISSSDYEDTLTDIGANAEQIASRIPELVEKGIAYSLTMSNPASANLLFEELSYWKSKGRF